MDEEGLRKRVDQLFGQIATRLGILTPQKLEKALEIQRSAKGRKPLGQLLLELDFVSPVDLQRILEAQRALLSEAHTREKALREDNLFGKVAIRLGFCTEERVAECLALQRQLPKDRFLRLGDILVLKGFLAADQVRRITDTQKGLIVYCPQCDTQYNVVMFQPGASLHCYRCGSTLRVPARSSRLPVDKDLHSEEG